MNYKKCLVLLIACYTVISSAVFLMFLNVTSNKTYKTDLKDSLSFRTGNAELRRSSKGHFNPCDQNNGYFLGKKNLVCEWYDDRQPDTSENYVMYGREFAILKNVVIDPKSAVGKHGGENLSTVMNQKESDEYLNLKKSYFTLQCSNPKHLPFNARNHLNDWIGSLTCVNNTNDLRFKNVISGFTIAVQRYEYVNLYHTMTDYYNAYVMMLLFQQSPEYTNILFIDAHPAGSLDYSWQKLFADVYRSGNMTAPTKFNSLVWSVLGYNSPLNNHALPHVPFLEEFRNFFLERHRVIHDKKLDCGNLSVLFIWRRDYVAHPRNPSGLLSRKIKNENEILDSIKNLLPGHNVQGVQLDKLPMTSQLELIANTDILVGMHGAGLTHTLFLPGHAGLLEFYPTYWPQSNRHFRTMCAWRHLHYLTWKNHDVANEFPGKLTYIPPQTVVNMVKEMRGKICK